MGPSRLLRSDWSILIGPGSRLSRIDGVLGALGSPESGVERHTLSDVDRLLSDLPEAGRALLDADLLALEDVGIVRRFLERQRNWHVLLTGGDPQGASARALSGHERVAWAHWPLNLLDLSLLLEAPEGLSQAPPHAPEPSTRASALSRAPRSSELEEVERILRAGTDADDDSHAQPDTDEDDWDIPPSPDFGPGLEPGGFFDEAPAMDLPQDTLEGHGSAELADEIHPGIPADELSDVDEEIDPFDADEDPPTPFAEPREDDESELDEVFAEDSPWDGWPPDPEVDEVLGSLARDEARPQPATTAAARVLPPPYFRDQVADLADIVQRLQLSLASLRRMADEEGVEVSLSPLESEVLRLSQFTRTLGYQAAPPPTGPLEFDLTVLLEELLAQISGERPQEARFLFRGGKDLFIRADKLLLCQAIAALAHLAQDCADPEEVVRVSTRLLPSGDGAGAGKVELGIEFPSGQLRSIAPETVLEPYALRRVEGISVGPNSLAAAEGIVRGQGGELILSAPEPGRLHWQLRLPVRERAPEKGDVRALDFGPDGKFGA